LLIHCFMHEFQHVGSSLRRRPHLKASSSTLACSEHVHGKHGQDSNAVLTVVLEVEVSSPAQWDSYSEGSCGKRMVFGTAIGTQKAHHADGSLLATIPSQKIGS